MRIDRRLEFNCNASLPRLPASIAILAESDHLPRVIIESAASRLTRAPAYYHGARIVTIIGQCRSGFAGDADRHQFGIPGPAFVGIRR